MAKFDIDGDLIRKLAEILADTDMNELEIEEGENRIRLTRGATQINSVMPMAAPMAAAPAVAAPAPAAPAAAPAAPAAEAAPADLSNHPGAVTSPMVGTAYASPEPGAQPFVSVGDSVSEGQTLLIVEAMKVMNPIKAPKSGTVTQILAKDASPVEFGEVLLIIE